MSGDAVAGIPAPASAALPLVVALALAIGVHVPWVIGLALDQVPGCLPYLEGCTSISRAARQEPQIFVYRAFITATGVLLVPFWTTTARWHALMHPDGPALLRRAFVVLGVVAAVCLVVNAALLGTELRGGKTARKIVVLIFFFGSFFALAMASVSFTLASAASGRLRGHARAGNAIAALMLALGALLYVLLPLSETLSALKDPLENIVEWNWVALLCAWLAANGIAWRASGLGARWSLG